jgi:hypothetical protein
LLLPGWASAADILNIKVDREGKIYTLRSEVWFDVDRATLWSVFRNWDLSPDFSSWVVDARNVAPDETGRAGFYIQNRGCLLFYCKTLIREGYVEDEPYTLIRASAVAEKSDFDISNESWTFRSEDKGTIVIYELEMSPKAWIPPIIGPWVIKRKLKQDGDEALDRIEQIAQAQARGEASVGAEEKGQEKAHREASERLEEAAADPAGDVID